MLEIPLMVSPKHLEHVVLRFHIFQEVLAHRFGQLKTHVSQMELLRVSLNLGNKKTTINEERRHKLDKLNPGIVTESNELYQSILPDNHMEVRLNLSHVCASANFLFLPRQAVLI